MGLEREGGREEGPSVILPLACRTPLTLSVSRYRSLSRPERSRLWRIARPLCAIFMACVRALSLSLSLSLSLHVLRYPALYVSVYSISGKKSCRVTKWESLGAGGVGISALFDPLLRIYAQQDIEQGRGSNGAPFCHQLIDVILLQYCRNLSIFQVETKSAPSPG